jgi:cell fate regulator YaaT (PSP1 superfamily)
LAAFRSAFPWGVESRWAGPYSRRMGMVCAVSFERYGRLYYLDAGSHSPRVGDKVLVPTDDGPEVAECVWAAQWVSEDGAGFPQLAGIATDADLERDALVRRRKADAKVAAKRLVREHSLPMKVVGVDHLPAANRTTIYFTAPHRVDFRALVRDLGATLKCRVELRQLSARDEARVQGGIGPCGRDLCCATFLKDFEPVSIRMAKDQDLPLNPLRISGACGRLLCCLKYEHPLYVKAQQTMPAKGSLVETPDGPGRVIDYNVPGDTVRVRLAESGRSCSCSRASVCGSRQAIEERYGDDAGADAGTAAGRDAGPAVD